MAPTIDSYIRRMQKHQELASNRYFLITDAVHTSMMTCHFWTYLMTSSIGKYPGQERPLPP